MKGVKKVKPQMTADGIKPLNTAHLFCALCDFWRLFSRSNSDSRDRAQRSQRVADGPAGLLVFHDLIHRKTLSVEADCHCLNSLDIASSPDKGPLIFLWRSGTW
jgi:hypothetical protein